MYSFFFLLSFLYLSISSVSGRPSWTTPKPARNPLTERLGENNATSLTHTDTDTHTSIFTFLGMVHGQFGAVAHVNTGTG